MNKHFSQLFAVSILCVSVSVSFISCKKSNKKSLPKQIEITFKKEGELTLFRKGTDSILKKIDVEIASNNYERETGLMYRKSMEANQGMLFIFEDSRPRYFYMKNTYIPLDLIYIDENKSIVSFQKNAQPLNEKSLPSNANANYVLEVYAGLADKWNLQVGDSISYKEF